MLEKILCAAKKEGWEIEEGETTVLTAPVLNMVCTPQVIAVDTDGAEVIYLDHRDSLKTARFSLANVKDTVENTRHPLRSSEFFRVAFSYRQKIDQEFCNVRGMNLDALMRRQAFGFMPSARADFYSIKLLSIHPSEVWGDSWVDAALGKWK